MRPYVERSIISFLLINLSGSSNIHIVDRCSLALKLQGCGTERSHVMETALSEDPF